MTSIRENSRKPDPQGDDQTQPSKSPGEIESGDDDTTQAQGQRGVTTPMQPGRKDRQDPNEDVGGSRRRRTRGMTRTCPDPTRSARAATRANGETSRSKKRVGRVVVPRIADLNSMRQTARSAAVDAARWTTWATHIEWLWIKLRPTACEGVRRPGDRVGRLVRLSSRRAPLAYLGFLPPPPGGVRSPFTRRVFAGTRRDS